jgi:hypothetical protein
VWAGFGPRPCANGPAQQPILAQGVGAACVQSTVTPPVLTHDDPMPCSPAAHRRLRQRGVSGRSTYIEQLTHRAMWSCWVLTETVRHLEGADSKLRDGVPEASRGEEGGEAHGQLGPWRVGRRLTEEGVSGGVSS